jgi:hypothetical protein
VALTEGVRDGEEHGKVIFRPKLREGVRGASWDVGIWSLRFPLTQSSVPECYVLRHSRTSCSSDK